MKNTDLLTHSEKNQQADRLCAEKSGYYKMNAVSFLSCCFKMEKTHSERLSATKNQTKICKNIDRALKRTENDAQKRLQFPPQSRSPSLRSLGKETEALG